jgi:hypothetical protein
VLALTLFPCTASAAPVPQPGALSAAVRGLNLPAMEGGRLSRTRFPVFFAVDRHHGSFMSPDTAVFYSVNGHGPSARRYRSVSLEVLFRGVKPMEVNLPTTGRLIAGIGLSEEVRATVEAMLRAAVARADSLRIHAGHIDANVADVRETAGIQVRLEGHFYGSSGAFVILQFTDADVPEASWPSPGEIEKLQPPTRQRLVGYTDVAFYAPIVVTELRCGPAGRDAFRCRYAFVGGGDPEGPFKGGPYTDLFRRAADGRWRMEPAR